MDFLETPHRCSDPAAFPDMDNDGTLLLASLSWALPMYVHVCPQTPGHSGQNLPRMRLLGTHDSSRAPVSQHNRHSSGEEVLSFPLAGIPSLYFGFLGASLTWFAAVGEKHSLFPPKGGEGHPHIDFTLMVLFSLLSDF